MYSKLQTNNLLLNKNRGTSLLTIKFKYILLLLMIIPLIPIEGFGYWYPRLYQVLFVYITLVDVFLIVLLTIYKGCRPSFGMVMLLVIGAYGLIITFFKGGDVGGLVSIWTYTIPLLLLMEIYPGDLKNFLGVYRCYLTTLLLANFVLIILFPKGLVTSYSGVYLGRIWLLGYKSSLQYYVIPAIFLAYLEYVYKKKKVNLIFIGVLAHIECVASANTMLLMGLLMFDVVFLFQLHKWSVLDQIKTEKLVFVIIVANILIVGFTSLVLSNHYVQSFVQDILHKDITLSMRTGAWESTIEYFVNNPIWGYGNAWRNFRTSMYGRATAHAHNLFLEMMFQGGIIQLSMFMALLIGGCRQINRHKKSCASKVIFLSMLVLLIMYIFESILQKSSGGLWMVFILAYHIKDVEKAMRDTAL